MNYAEFLQQKVKLPDTPGRNITVDDVHPTLHDWQKELVVWAVKTSRAALWADTGLGKTFMQIEWARLSGETVLIVAPLAVCAQTVREASKLGVPATYVRAAGDVTGPGMWVTNYEMVEHFDPATFDAVVLDESSILKQSDGKTRTMLIDHFKDVPHRLACSATPAPNDPEELTNQAEFLGRMSRTHMLAAYFIHDSDGWRLKGHAKAPMMRWMATWAVALTKPSDMGGVDDGYDLPGLKIVPHFVDVEVVAEGQLFATELGGVSGRAKVRRETLAARVVKAVEVVNSSTKSPGLHETVLRSEQREVGPRLGCPREEECSQAGEVCIRSGAPRESESAGSGIAQASSVAAQGMDVWDRRGGSRSHDRRGMPDLPREPTLRCDSQDTHRSRPFDGSGSGRVVSAVQSGIGAFAGRPDPGYGDVRLPHEGSEQWVVWCGLNDEQDALAKAFGDRCRSLDGRTPLDLRVEINEAWIRGDFQVLIVKPGMYSQGMNWQHCARMAFVGLGDSYEQYYQAIRRCYRYGQTRVVEAHVILSDLESQIATNIARKERQASGITTALVEEMRRVRKELSTV